MTALEGGHAQANVQATNNDGSTALIFSAANGHDGCLRQLLEAKVRAMRTRVDRCAAPCLEGAVHVLCASTREEDRALVCRTQDAGFRRRVCVCVCVLG